MFSQPMEKIDEIPVMDIRCSGQHGVHHVETMVVGVRFESRIPVGYYCASCTGTWIRNRHGDLTLCEQVKDPVVPFEHVAVNINGAAARRYRKRHG
jgi:hypothetical protein